MPEPKKTAKTTPVVSGNLLSDSSIAPLLEPPQDETSTDTVSSVLQAALDRQEQELSDLETEMDRRADEFADRAAAIVRTGLERAYAKAHAKIITIDLPFFDSPPRSTSLASLPQRSIEEEAKC